MNDATPGDWREVSRRHARSVQTTNGWIFWDPGALARYAKLGLPGDLGYIAARSTPFAERLEPTCEKLLARVDETARPNYQPASRIREPR